MVKKNFLKSSLIVLAVLIMAVAFLPTTVANAAVDKTFPTLTYSAHVQNVGWMSNSRAGEEESQISRSFAGSEGKSQRLEALKVTFTAPDGVVLKYDAHIQGDGWTGWNVLNKANQLVGTEGQSKRLEALKLSVTGLEGYEIKYRAHVQGIGWQDWLTVDNSQDETSNFVGTQGQSKRIEAIEVLILPAAKADIFDARQEAIADLMTYANANDYKKNATLLQKEIDAGLAALNDVTTANDIAKITKALNAAEDKIDEVLTDRQINEKLTALNTSIDDWAKCLDVNIRNKEELGKYIDVPAIKQAIADAKAEAANKEQYLADDFTNKLKDEACESVRYVLKEYVLDLAEEVYKTKATSDDDKLLKSSVYNGIKLALEDTETEKKCPLVSAIMTEVAKLDSDSNLVKLSTMRGNYKTAVADIVGAETVYEKSVFANSTGTASTNATNLKKLLSDQASITKYSQVSYIANVVSNADTLVNEATSTAEFDEIFNETETNVLNGLRTFIRNTLTTLTNLENVSELYLRTANNANYNTLVSSLNNDKAKASDLLDQFKDVLDNLIAKGA